MTSHLIVVSIITVLWLLPHALVIFPLIIIARNVACGSIYVLNPLLLLSRRILGGRVLDGVIVFFVIWVCARRKVEDMFHMFDLERLWNWNV